MSGNQESGVKLPSWRCSDFNAAIPIKKRKYFVQPQLPPVEEEQPNEQGGVSKSGLDLSGANENKKAIDGSRVNVGEQSVSVGNVGKAVAVSGQVRVKVEEPNFPVHSGPLMLTGFEIPSKSNILGSSLEKRPVGAEQTGVVVTSVKTGMKVEQSVPKTNDIVRESKNNQHRENEEPTALNLSLSKGVYAPQNTDCVSTCNKSGNHSGVNRSNWDLNTTMDAWEDGLDRRTRAKTSGHDIETSSCPDATIVAKSASEKEEKSVGFESHAVALMPFDHQVKPSPTCSLSLGLGSYPPAEKYPSGSATTSGTIAAGTSSSRPITGYPNSVNLRTVKSEVIEESVRQSAKACPVGLSINRVKQEAVGRINQENSPSSGILKFVQPVSIKAEPNSFSQSEVFNRKDGTLSHFHTPVTQAVVPMSLDAILDVPMSLNGMRVNQGVQNYPDCTANEYAGQSNCVANGKLSEVLKSDGVPMTSCSGRGDHNLNTPGVNVTSLTEGKIVVDNSKTCVAKEFPLNYRGTGEVSRSYEERTTLSGKELVLQRDGLCENEGQRAQDDEQSTHQIIHTSEGVSGVSTESGGNVENPENVNNNSPVSYKEGISTIDNDPRTEFNEGSQRRIINLTQVSNKSPIKILDASGSYMPLEMERERLPDFPVESQRYLSRGSDESCKFLRERYPGKVMRSPRLNFIPERRRFSNQTESDLHDRDTKDFEFNNHGNNRRDEDFISNFRRVRRPANDEGTPYSNSFTRRTPNFSFTHRGQRNKDDTSAFPGFRDGEKATRGLLGSNNTEQMFMSPPRSYRGRNGGYARGQTNFSDNSKRRFPGFRSRSPVRSRERSTGPSSSFRNRSQEEFGGQTDFSHRRSPSGYRTERTSSPDHTGYTRETVVRRHNSPPYSHRPSNGRGRGFGRGRGYIRGRGYGRAGDSFRKPSDRFVHRNHGNMNNFNRERVNYNDDLFEGPVHSERFGDVNVERRRFGYRHDGTNSFRPSYNKDGCAPTNVEKDPDALRYEQEPHIETDGQGSDMEIDAEDDNTAENASGGDRNLDEEEEPLKQN